MFGVPSMNKRWQPSGRCNADAVKSMMQRSPESSKKTSSIGVERPQLKKHKPVLTGQGMKLSEGIQRGERTQEWTGGLGDNVPRPPPPPETKKKYKFKPRTVALREIRKYQKSTEPIIPKAPFARVVREIIDNVSDNVTRVEAVALDALRDATEDLATSLFQDGVLCHVHAKRVTLKPVDLTLAMRLRQDDSLRK